MTHMSQVLNHALYLFVMLSKDAGISKNLAIKLVEQTYDILD